MDDSAVARVELQRVELENNIAKLRRSLRHWQTLEIDYEGLKEEFLGIPEDASADDCLLAARDFKPETIDENGLQDLLRDKNSKPRQPRQLVDLLSKRVDYVIRNIETIRKQVSDAEKKRNALLLAEEPEHRDDAGLPLAEITEELDESGQVISSKVETPGAGAPQLIDVLKQAGVHDLEETNGTITKAEPSAEQMKVPALGAEEDEADEKSHPNKAPMTATDQGATSPADIFPTNPNDTEAEAELRREMLEYSRGLDEVGAIVAELELEEDASDLSYDEDEDDPDFDTEMDLDEDLEEDDSEDESGKSKHPLSLPRGYQKKMEELQEKLGLKNIGPQSEIETSVEHIKRPERPPAAEAARKAAIARHDKSKKGSLKTALSKSEDIDKSGKEKPSKKKVAFSTDLDIAPDKPPASTSSMPDRPLLNDSQKPKLRPIKDSVIERAADEDEQEPPAPTAPAPKAAKQSRFKAARASLPQTPKFAPPMTFPTDKVKDAEPFPQPPSTIVSAQLVERPSPQAPKAPDPDDFSEDDHRREIAMEYQQHRMKRILSQDGGFLGNSEDGEITPLEDENGRRVSRFKAASIKR
ncbi:uncharacterized protein Z520_06681 [Fonsecaea multimorphosa CBS 102226]|uniref:DUF3835 domain-containing protein n=1 Tax=Fonsecaea multimorphosa CBS 102226 TaxID=1442371 RepID=A0A0D2KMM8_9EURO|nr:uncharacterized protein Z520_06681 [Fonsecaea multimorphosa CBS 102226]KIX97903.1 hypothetical protein Z520_06681 [Fonsecaea multimorphosa CBS 102226]OAL23673.1 hypothetical protein AYO22_06250 [Fonsecaea multimorphosa]